MNLLPFNLRRDVRRTLEDCMGRHLRASDTVCDVGCGTKPFGRFLARVAGAHVGIDMDGGFYGEEAVDIIGVADRLPVRDGVADAVLSSQVIEHLPDPEEALREARHSQAERPVVHFVSATVPAPRRTARFLPLHRIRVRSHVPAARARGR